MHASYTHLVFVLIALRTASARTFPRNVKVTINHIQDEEDKISVGGNIELTEEEVEVNKILMKHKYHELDTYFPHNSNFSKHYFNYRKHITNSKVYQIIKRMPKGAILHAHSSFLLGADYFMNLTYKFGDNLYACYSKNSLKLQFSEDTPHIKCDVKWNLLSELRNSADDVADFDKKLKDHFTMYSDDIDYEERDSNDAWKKFDGVHKAMKSMLSYRPIREKYIKDAIKYFYDDNIMYIEMRSGLNSLYELNGTVHDGKYMAKLHEDIANEFKKCHPDFIGLKIIISNNRRTNEEKLQKNIAWALEAKEEMPDLIVGFDLVGQEDLGYPLSQLFPYLMAIKGKIDFFFHAGETNWNGMSTDLNIMNAINLGTKRIGHGFSIVKHPVLMSVIKEKDIALEVNVVSNVVLGYVKDMRNHPLATFLALGLPVVLSSDDPGAWESDPLSQDFYLAFVAVANRNADLRLLKQLALNSIKYSGLDIIGKKELQASFDKRWKTFLKEILELSD